MDDSVKSYFDKQPADHRAILLQLRKLIVGTEHPFVETLKWGAPTYVGKKNVCSLVAFKNHVALWFHQGALLSDPNHLLVASTGKTKAMRQIKFSSLLELNSAEIMQLVENAFQLDAQGLKVKHEEKPELVPTETVKSFLEENQLWEAFCNLSKGHRNEYIEYINEAKRDETKQRRMLKMKSLLSQNLDLNAKYRK